MSNVEEMQESWNKFSEIVEKLENEGLSKLVATLGEDLLMSPANAQKDEFGCHPGGCIEFALLLAQNMRKINIVAEYGIDAKSIYTVAFLRALGEYGTSAEKMFTPHDSDWHIEKLGLIYKRNTALNGTNWCTRAIELAITFGVVLSSEETLAIMTCDNDHQKGDLAKLLKSSTTIIF